LNKTDWIPSFAGRQGRNINEGYIDLLKNHSYSSARLEALNYRKLVIEIGFGYGEVLLTQAEQNKETAFIGCEVYLAGLAKLMEKISTSNISNILVYQGDGRQLVQSLKDESIDSIMILFPDPWPKKRHHKRRIINEEFLKLMAKKLKFKGELIIATDHLNYFL